MFKFRKKTSGIFCFALLLLTAFLFTTETCYAGTTDEKRMTKAGRLNRGRYNLAGGMEVVGDTLYMFKATTGSLSDVALLSAKIDGATMKTGPFTVVKKFKNYEMGHANDCTYYDNRLFVAPYGKNTVRGITSYYDAGGKVNSQYFPIVSVALNDGMNGVAGYELKDMNGINIPQAKISGITRIDDIYYGNYPVFCLKTGNTLMYCYLNGNIFYNYFTCKVTIPSLAGDKNLGQGVTYHDGYLYFGLGVLNGDGVCTADAYISRLYSRSLDQYNNNVCEAYYIKDYSDKYEKFEVECVTFYNDYCIFNINGKLNPVSEWEEGPTDDLICVLR